MLGLHEFFLTYSYDIEYSIKLEIKRSLTDSFWL